MTLAIREATTRQNVAMVDVSTLGKIAVQGPDATEFLNQTMLIPLPGWLSARPDGRIMLRDDGMVLDDGTTWRLAEDDWFWRLPPQQRPPRSCVFGRIATTPLDRFKGTYQLGHGSMGRYGCCRALCARNIIHSISSRRLVRCGFSFHGVREITFDIDGREIISRIARISQAARLKFASLDSGTLWASLANHIKEVGGCLYGMEALGALRIEKGHVTAAELDEGSHSKMLDLARWLLKQSPLSALYCAMPAPEC